MVFFLVIFILPLIEISLFAAIGSRIGVWNTILLYILTGAVGIFLLKVQGVRTLTAMQSVVRRGHVPLQEMFDGFCLAMAALLFILPGFFGDLVALALLVPGVRAWLRGILVQRYGFREMTNAEEDIIDAEFRRVDAERIGRHE